MLPDGLHHEYDSAASHVHMSYGKLHIGYEFSLMIPLDANHHHY
jgi:hypothetical protein